MDARQVWGDYTLDLALEALLRAADASGCDGYRDYVFAIARQRGWTPGTVVRHESQPFSCLDFALYRATGDAAWLPVFISETRRMQAETPRSLDGAILHPRGKARGGHALLIDGLQNYASRMAKAGSVTGDASFFSDCAEQFRIHRAILRDPATGLWCQGRGWVGTAGEARGDFTSRISDPRCGDAHEPLSPGAWSRGHGWLIRGVVDSLEYLPRDSEEFSDVAGYLEELAQALLPLQDAGGMWHCLLDRPHEDSAAETSGTALIACHLARAVRLGFIAGDGYRTAAARAFAALPAFVDDTGAVLSVSPGPGPLESESPYLHATFPPGNEHGPFALLFAWAEQELFW